MCGEEVERAVRKRPGVGHIHSKVLSKNIWLSFFTLSGRLLKPSCLLLILFGLTPFPPTSLSGCASINGPVEVESAPSDVGSWSGLQVSAQAAENTAAWSSAREAGKGSTPCPQRPVRLGGTRRWIESLQGAYTGWLKRWPVDTRVISFS